MVEAVVVIFPFWVLALAAVFLSEYSDRGRNGMKARSQVLTRWGVI